MSNCWDQATYHQVLHGTDQVTRSNTLVSGTREAGQLSFSILLQCVPNWGFQVRYSLPSLVHQHGPLLGSQDLPGCK